MKPSEYSMNPDPANMGAPVTPAQAELPDYKVAAVELQALFASLGITATVTGAHAAIDETPGEGGKVHKWAHVAVTVTFTRKAVDNGHGSKITIPACSISTEYRLGVGLVKWADIAKSVGVRYNCTKQREAEAMARSARLYPEDQARIAGEHLPAFVKAVKPAEVLASLCRDGQDAIGQSFEEWARGLGYDTDSRKAESIYRACQECGDKARKLLSHNREAFAKLAELANRL